MSIKSASKKSTFETWLTLTIAGSKRISHSPVMPIILMTDTVFTADQGQF